MTYHSQSGNVLWFILVAIALIGILTGILTRSGSSVDQGGDVEQSRIKASSIMRYAKGLEEAITQMKLRGISENEISFENDKTSVDYTNDRCNRDDCLLFDVNGGGQVYLPPPAGTSRASEWLFTGYNNVGNEDGPVGTTEDIRGNDLLIMLPGISQSLCTQINRDLGVANPGGKPPRDENGIGLEPFTGTFFDAGGAPVTIDADPPPFELNRKQTACFYDDNSGQLIFYHAILVR